MPEIYEPVLLLGRSDIHLAETCRIDSFTDIRGGQGVYVGEGVHVASHCSVNIGNGTVILEDYSALAAGCRVLGGSNTMLGVSMSAAAPREMQVVRTATTVVRRCAFVGANAVVMPGVTIGEGAVIGAGAVVTRDVPPGEVWAGVPARKIGDRGSPPLAFVSIP